MLVCELESAFDHNSNDSNLTIRKTPTKFGPYTIMFHGNFPYFVFKFFKLISLKKILEDG